MVNAEVASGGELSFDGQVAGRIQGFRYTPDASVRADSAAVDADAMANAIAQEFEVRAARLSEAIDGALILANDGVIRWLGDPVAKIAGGDALLAPRALVLADDSLTEGAQQKVQARVDLWLAAYVRRLLGPLFELDAGVGLDGAARHVAAQLVEALGVLERGRVAQDVKTLDQSARGALRKLGVRFGAYYIYIPALVKPAIRVLATQLWALRQGDAAVGAGVQDIAQFAASGRTSFLADSAIPKEIYRVAGFRLCGDRAVRVDIVERLADLIRPAVAYRPGVTAGSPPPGSADADGFVVTGAMTSLTGCSGEQFASVLRSLGFVSHLVKGPVLTIPEPAPTQAAPAGTDVLDSADASTAIPDEGAEPPPPEAPTAAIDGESGEGRVTVDVEPAAIEISAGEQPSEAAAETPAIPPADADSGAEASIAEQDQPEGEPLGADSAEAVASVSALPGAGESEPAQEPLVEIWRPRPPSRQRAPRSGARRNAPGPQTASPAADAQEPAEGAPSEERGSRRRRPFQRPPHSKEADAESKPSADAQRPRGGRAAFRQPNPANGGAGRSGRSQRSGAPDERNERERRPERAPPPVAQREPAVNLNSPFAKLLALKAQLETKGKGD